jgi:hypothetical protein
MKKIKNLIYKKKIIKNKYNYQNKTINIMYKKPITHISSRNNKYF